MDNYDWQVGQEVMVRSVSFNSLHPGVIVRLTKTRVVLQGGMAFNRAGRQIPYSGYTGRYIQPMTPEYKAEVERDNLLGVLERQRCNWYKLSTDALRKIVAVIDSDTQPQSPETAPAAPTGAAEVGSRNVD